MLLPCLGQIPISSFLVGGGGVGGGMWYVVCSM